MKTPIIVDKEKLAEIIEYASKEISSKNDGVSKETITSHIVEKMKEVLEDDN